MHLNLWRQGAVPTPNRRWCNHASPGLPHCSTACPFCHEPVASMRHFWAKCSRFEASRAEIIEQFELPP
eukprot:7149542-Alexandrium_andersonii.AAC.1